MSGMDSVQFNTLERALSSDVNNLESDQQRAILETLRYMLEARTPVAGTFGTRANRNVVVGGLNVTPSGDHVQVQPGLLLQDSGALAPVPGALDSSYRWAWHRAAEVVNMPAPGGTTFYLLEAQMVEVVALAVARDIYNPGLGVFVPAMVDKLLERQLDFQVTAGAGGNYPALTGGDWIPVAGVRRPGGGGAVAASDIDDLRDLWNAISYPQSEATTRVTRSARVLTSHTPGGAASNSLRVLGAAFPSGGQLGIELAYAESAAEDWTTATFVDPTMGAFVADTWYYLYLCPWQALAPSGFYANANGHRGIVVLTDVAPTLALPLSSAPIDLPAPWGVAQVPTAAASCIGAVRRNSANTGWDWQGWMGGGWHRTELRALASLTPPIIGANTVTTTAKVPLNADAWRIRIAHTVDGGATALQIDVAPTGVATSLAIWSTQVASQDSIEIDVPVALLGATDFDLILTGANAPAVLEVDLVAVHYPSP